MLLIHGWGGSSQYWQGCMRAFGADWRCIAPDLPGFGQSPPVRDTAVYSHHGFAGVLAGLLDELGVAQCDVVAHSYGCGVAIMLAHDFPAQVRRVVLSNFSTFRSEGERKLVDVMHRVSGATLLLRRFGFARGDGFARMLGAQYFHTLPPQPVLRAGLEDFLAMDASAANESVVSSLGWETPRALQALTQPVLLIHSHEDRIMPPRNAKYTAALAPRGQLRWISPSGHLPMIEQQDAWVAAVRAFLE